MAARYVYRSAYTITPAAYVVEQRDGDDLSLTQTITDAAYCGIAGTRLWTSSTVTSDVMARNLDDISIVDLTAARTGELRVDNDHLYFVVRTGSATTDQLIRHDTSDGSVLWTVTGSVGLSPDSVADDGTHVYVAAVGSPFRLTKIETATGSVVGSVNLGNEPTDLQVINGDLFVSFNVAPQLRQVDTSSMTVTNTYSYTGFGIQALTTDGTDLIYGRGLDLFRFSPSTGTVVETLNNTSFGHQKIVHNAGNVYSATAGTTAGRLSRFSTNPLAQEYAFGNLSNPQLLNIAAWDGIRPGPSGIFVGAVVF